MEQIDNSEFLSIVHQLVGDSEDCIIALNIHAESQDEKVQGLLGATATLLRLHVKIVTGLVEQNAKILDQANTLLEQINQMEEK